MIKLFATGTTRALPPCMVLEESGVPYDLVVVDIRQSERPSDLLKFNPQGRMPSLIDGDLAFDQSVAILVYLAEKFDIFLPKTPPERTEVLRQLMAASTDIMFGHATVFRMMRASKGHLDTLLYDYRQRLLSDLAKSDELLRNRPYLAGELSIADFYLYAIVGQYDAAAIKRLGFDALQGWIDRIRARPAVRSAEQKCPYLYDVSGTLGDDPYTPEVAVDRFRPVA